MKRINAVKKVFNKSILLLLIPIVFLSCCQKIGSNQKQQNSIVKISDYYPSIYDNKATSLAFVDRHESQHWTDDLPYLVSYPLNWKFIFLKYVVNEDLYGNIEKGKVILLPFGLSLSKSNNGARPDNICSTKNNDPTTYDSNNKDRNLEVPSTQVFRTINKEIARYYFTSYSNFLIYLKNYQPANNETILSELDLHNYDASETDLSELKKDVDYVAAPTYLDRDLDALPFNVYNNGVLEITRFYVHFYNEGLTECPIFYNRYELAMRCFEDDIDTFETVKNKLDF